MEISKVAKTRAEVTEDFIQIETLVGTIITDYYIGQNNPIAPLFMLEMLYDEHCTFAMNAVCYGKYLMGYSKRKRKERKRKVNFRNYTDSTKFETSLRIAAQMFF